MTDANPYRTVAQDPEFRQQVAKDAQQASPETIDRYYALLNSKPNQAHNAHDTLAQIRGSSQLEIYTRMGNKHFLTGPDFFAESEDGHVWNQLDPDQAKIAYALAQYEEARMAHYRAKPKFILEIDGNHFAAKRSRGGLIDVVLVAIAGGCWFAVLAGAWMIFG